MKIFRRRRRRRRRRLIGLFYFILGTFSVSFSSATPTVPPPPSPSSPTLLPSPPSNSTKGSNSLVVGKVQGSCTRSYTFRKDIRDLSDRELSLFFNGFNWAYDQGLISFHSKNHYRYSPYIHGKGAFLPYHRKLLVTLERSIQLGFDSHWSLPFWNTTTYSQQPWNDPVLKSGFLGDSRTSNCIKTGDCQMGKDWGKLTSLFFLFQSQFIKVVSRSDSFSNSIVIYF